MIKYYLVGIGWILGGFAFISALVGYIYNLQRGRKYEQKNH